MTEKQRVRDAMDRVLQSYGSQVFPSGRLNEEKIGTAEWEVSPEMEVEIASIVGGVMGRYAPMRDAYQTQLSVELDRGNEAYEWVQPGSEPQRIVHQYPKTISRERVFCNSYLSCDPTVRCTVKESRLMKGQKFLIDASEGVREHGERKDPVSELDIEYVDDHHWDCNHRMVMHAYQRKGLFPQLWSAMESGFRERANSVGQMQKVTADIRQPEVLLTFQKLGFKPETEEDRVQMGRMLSPKKDDHLFLAHRHYERSDGEIKSQAYLPMQSFDRNRKRQEDDPSDWEPPDPEKPKTLTMENALTVRMVKEFPPHSQGKVASVLHRMKRGWRDMLK